ncbi:hypothetical protein [Corynebacterium glyciniphilum]|uniref:hypothetical protein n=1 Tax=Corynebacterium glyciniphilum TaxID=1404244 RepID=UPI0011AB6A18|nr:hypothetical protein [Corynebacterium glyciniphilum]
MDFTLECNLPIRPPNTSEEVQVGETLRQISYQHYRTGELEVEVHELLPGDSLCGVDLSSTPIKVQKDLHRAGYTSTLELSGLSLNDHPISMYIFEDEIASICWSWPAPNNSEG